MCRSGKHSTHTQNTHTHKHKKHIKAHKTQVNTKKTPINHQTGQSWTKDLNTRITIKSAVLLEVRREIAVGIQKCLFLSVLIG